MYMPRSTRKCKSKSRPKEQDTMSSQANNITAIDSKKPTTKQELIAANKQDVSVGPPTCGLTVVWRAHRAARRNPLGFSLHPFPDASGPARRLRGRSHAPRGTG